MALARGRLRLTPKPAFGWSCTGSRVFVFREGPFLGATLRLTTRQPWLGDISFLTTCERALYLTSMAVRPERQRHGLGRECLADARRIAGELKADMIRLDSYAGPAGASGFYRACGFREVHRAECRGTPLVFFETPV